MLNDIEKKILSDLYDRDINNVLEIKIGQEQYDLLEETSRGRTQELVHYLEKLERLSLIKIQRDKNGKTYTSGGSIHPKYKNNALFDIDDKNIHIADKGIEYITDLRKTFGDKSKDWLKELFKDAGTEISKEIIKYIFFFIAGFVLGKII